MDKEEILKKNQYKHNKITFFQRHEVKFEILALFVVGISLFYLGTSILISNKNACSYEIENSNNSLKEDKTLSKEDLTEDKSELDSSNSSKTDNQIDSLDKIDSTLKEDNNSPELNRLTIKNVLGLVIYSKEHKNGDIITLDNVAIGSYFLGDSTDMTLFTTNTSNNKVECTIGEDLQTTICNVTEIEIPVTQ